jgi:hypothetical protein
MPAAFGSAILGSKYDTWNVVSDSNSLVNLIVGAVIRNKDGGGAVTDLNGVFTIEQQYTQRHPPHHHDWL